MPLDDDEVLLMIDGHPMTAKGLVELGKYLEEIESISIVSHEHAPPDRARISATHAQAAAEVAQ
jgi:hypothetical protein